LFVFKDIENDMFKVTKLNLTCIYFSIL